MTKEEIKQSLIEAGWQLDDGFSGHLVIGEDHDLSVLVPRWAWDTRDPAFELCDRERGVSHWVREIPTPRQAATLLYEHGGEPEEDRGKPHKRDGG